MIRVSCDTHDEADAIWQQLHTAQPAAAVSVQLWVADALVAQFRCGGDGCSALHADQPARSC